MIDPRNRKLYPKDIEALSLAFMADLEDDAKNEGILVHHAGCWWQYTGTRYAEVSDQEMDGKARKWLARKRLDITSGLVANLLAQTRANAGTFRQLQAPFWFDDTDRPDASQVIAFRNGLLDVAAWVRGQVRLMPHTSDWFSPSRLPFPFDPEARCPVTDQYLRDVLVDDDQIDLAEEWAGYCLTHSNQFQKLLFLLGPTRSGKTTYLELLAALVGKENNFGGSLQSIASQFGVASLVGKQLLTTSEIHLAGNEGKRAVQLLKNITGGDRVAIDRKYRDVVSMVLPVRITLAANQMPRLPDDSNALAARMLLLHFPNSYLGREDHELKEKLKPELAGFANKALAGLARLHARGRFLQPERGKPWLKDFAGMSAPVEEFLADCCDEGPGLYELTDSMYHAWAAWCRKAGHVAGARNSFGARLAAARPNSRNSQRRIGGGMRLRVYEGVELAVDGIRLLEQWDGRDGLVGRANYRRMVEHAGLKVESPAAG